MVIYEGLSEHVTEVHVLSDEPNDTIITDADGMPMVRAPIGFKHKQFLEEWLSPAQRRPMGRSSDLLGPIRKPRSMSRLSTRLFGVLRSQT